MAGPHTQVDAGSSSLLILFLKLSPLAHPLLESHQSYLKGCAFPCPVPMSCPAFVPRPVWHIQYEADSQSRHSAESGQAGRADIPGPLSKAPKRFQFLASVTFLNMLAAITACLPHPQSTEKLENVVNSSQALGK